MNKQWDENMAALNKYIGELELLVRQQKQRRFDRIEQKLDWLHWSAMKAWAIKAAEVGERRAEAEADRIAGKEPPWPEAKDE